MWWGGARSVVGEVGLTWVSDGNLEGLAGSRRCGSRGVGVSVCVVGRCEFASDGVFEYICDNVATPERRRPPRCLESCHALVVQVLCPM